MVQLLMVMFSHGPNWLRSVPSTPDLSVIQSSPTSTWQLEICTFRQESGLMPSVLGESGGLRIMTLLTVTHSQRTGLMVQLGELTRLMPSMRIFRQSAKETSL